MEKYKQSLKLQNTAFLIGAVCLTAVQILAFCGIFTPAVSNAHWADSGPASLPVLPWPLPSF